MSKDFLEIFDIEAKDLAVQERDNSTTSDVLYKPDWKNKMKDGKYVAKMRFLTNPFAPTESIHEVIKYYLRDEQAQMSKYFTSSLSIGDKSCPIYKTYWSLKNIAKKNNNSSLSQYADDTFKYSREYLAYVYIIKDYNDISNDGKVFLYPFKKQVLNVLNDKLMGDEIKGKDPVNVFHPVKGADFILDIRMKSFENNLGRKIDAPNYESSEFTDVCPFKFEGHDCSTEDGLAVYKERFFDGKDNLPNINDYSYKPRTEIEERELQEFLQYVIDTRVKRKTTSGMSDSDVIKEKFFGTNDSTGDSTDEDVDFDDLLEEL